MSRMIFVDLPVGDLQRSIDFWSELGPEFNPQFTDDQPTCMSVSDHACVMLLTQEYFSRALSLGASFVREPEDHGYMYGRSFEDLDGHVREVGFMDPAALEEQTV